MMSCASACSRTRMRPANTAPTTFSAISSPSTPPSTSSRAITCIAIRQKGCGSGSGSFVADARNRSARRPLVGLSRLDLPFATIAPTSALAETCPVFHLMKDAPMSALRIALILMLASLFTGCGYNTLQSQDEQVKAAWSEVLNQYQRRADLVPNLVNTVTGAIQSEKDSLESV